MIYTFDIDTPANTLEADPLFTRLELELGIISQLGIGFPEGAAGLTNVTIWRDGRQVWPSNGQGSFSWDDRFFTWPEAYDLTEAPFEFTARTWNVDDTWDHRITIQFAILQPGSDPEARQEISLLQQIAGFLGPKRRRAN